MKNLLKQYFDLQKDIHNYFNYKEDWVTIPLSDETEHEWMLIGDGTSSSDVIYYGPILNAETINAGIDIYSGHLYTQRFLSR
jgi:hypothetical protein